MDGRIARSARSREAIIDAAYALIGDGEEPTAERIAKHADVSLRTVFHQFADLDGVYAGVAARLVRELVPTVPPPPPSGVLAEDVSTLVERRARANERIVPFLRAARRLRGQPTVWPEQEQVLRRALRRGLERAVAPHLAKSPASVEALELLLSPEAWERLRFHQHLSVGRAIEVVASACRAVLSTGAGPRA